MADFEGSDEEEEKVEPFETFCQEALKCIVVVDGLPTVTEDKYDKLQKHLMGHPSLLKTWGSTPKEVNMPIAAGKTQGFAFIEFDTPELAARAKQTANGYKLDKSHMLATNLMEDFERIINTEQEYSEPPVEQFKEQENLRGWLMDEQARDQFVVRYDDETKVFWNNAIEGPELDKEQKRWSDSYVRWSPYGQYMATFHHQGILLWGGSGWQKLRKLAVTGVVDILFSPKEQFVITWSPQKGAMVWELRSGKMLREFSEMVNADKFGKFCWSANEEYVARIAKDKAGSEVISIYTLKSDPPMMLLDKKSIKAPGVEEIVWSPTDNFLTYWQPETEGNPCRVIVMEMPAKKVVSQKNLFNVNTCQINWQGSGDYLCVKVERLTKGKALKKDFNFELFRMREKNIPTEVLKMDCPVVDFKWEPKGHRFIVIFGENARPDVAIYTLKDAELKQVGETLEKKPANNIFWAPQGQFCVMAGLQSPALNGVLEFWDMNSMEMMGYQEHLMCTNVNWDPTGRFVCTYVSALRQNHPMENGYNIYNSQGVELHSEMLEKFYQFVWRPRPPTPLDEPTLKDIRKNLNKFSKKLDDEDAKRIAILDSGERERREKLKEEWSRYTTRWTKMYAKEKDARTAAQGYDSDDEQATMSDTVQSFETVEEVVSVSEEIIEPPDE
jgi:translation initiation factor 3 subunit B